MFKFEKAQQNETRISPSGEKWIEKAGKYGNVLKLFILLTTYFLASKEAVTQNEGKLDGKNILVNGTSFNFELGADSAMSVNGVIFKEEDGSFLLNGKKIVFHAKEGEGESVDVSPTEIEDFFGKNGEKIKVLSIKMVTRKGEYDSKYVDAVNISNGEVVSSIFVPEKNTETPQK